MKKRISNIVLLVLIFAVLLPVRALAANDKDEVRISEEGTITIVSGEAAKGGISSLQFGLQVQPAEQDAKVSFAFSDSTAKIAEFRYHENKDGNGGVLNIYLAGTTALFADSDALSVGTVVVQDQDGKDVVAEVSVAEDSLKYVYVTEMKTAEAKSPEQPVKIHAEQPATPGQPTDPAQPTKPDDGSGDASKSEAFKELQETLKNAESYAAGNYTGESYQAMKQAMEAAAAVLNSPMPTEEELANALHNLQNAMGALVLSNNDPKTEGGNGGTGNTGTNNKPGKQETSGQGGKKVESTSTGDPAPILPVTGLLLAAVIGLWYSCVSLGKKE